MKLISVVVEMLQFIKLSSINRAAEVTGIEQVIVHARQHTDPLLAHRI